jgi:class 3 adenylate cyclase/predicted ATPase
MDVAAWLQGLGLERYVLAFRDNEIDWEVLPKLTSEDLREIGVAAIGHRRKLLDAIAALSAAVPTAAVTAAASDTPAPADAERRQLTVLFCDLVGSTALSTRHDPEDLRELIGGYHSAVAETAGRFDGFVAKYMGDGVLIYFGYPHAHEDDAERAVRAGLAAIETVSKLPAREDLRVRLGIATGVVVVGDLIGEGAAQERGVVGETPNLAARLQALAGPNMLVIAETTRRQVGGLFDLADLGPQALAGFVEPQPAWQVLGESGEVSRFEALRSAETPLVGRDEEIELLIRRWQQAKSREGRVVLISGEPGIGKSRLTVALSEHIEAEPHTRLRYFCSPHHQDSALYPVIGQLERAAGLAHDDGPEAKLDKLATLVAPAAEAGDISLLVELLSLPGGDRFAPLALSPPRKKERTLAALLRQLEGLVRQQPVLMIFEDLHWIDPTSREFLDLVLARIDRLPVLLVATFRPEFQPPWTGQPYVTVIALNRLGRKEGAAMIQRLVGNAASLPRDVIAEIVERTDGVPLFVEEMTKAIIEAGVERGREVAASVPSTELGVPATLQASLMARLDRLGAAAKGVAQIGAAIGREFSYELAASVGDPAEERLKEALQRLVAAGLVFQRGMPPASNYLFKHALVQDTAYSTLLRGPRQALHARIARALEAGFPTIGKTRPEILAHHFTEAGLSEKAIGYWHRAGQQSVGKSAVVEAVGQLRRGLNLIDALPDNAERERRELDLQVTLGTALYSAKGSSHPETVEAHKRALELVRRTGSAGTRLEFSILLDTWMATLASGDASTTLEQARALLEIARSGRGSAMLVVAHRALGSALVMNGDYRGGVPHLEQAAALFNPAEHRRDEFQSAQDIGVTVFSHLSWGLWHHGYPDRAGKAADEALRLTDGSVASIVSFAEMWACWTMLFSRRVAEAGDLANALVARATEHRMPMWSGFGLPLQGAVASQRGDSKAAVESIREGLSVLAAMGARYFEPFYLALLAEALAGASKIDDGLNVLAMALKEAEASGQRGNNAELHRLRGELLRQLPKPNLIESEACFRCALATAREQGTRGFELRAAVSLARLRRDQGGHPEARDLLAPVYDWFNEGFDTADLKEAKALIDELA